MNKKVFKLSIIDNKLPLFICFCFLAGTIISFYLSIIISTYFYLLAVPLLLITLYLIKLTIAAVKNEYKRLIKKEKHFNDGRHLEYFEDKKRQAKFELHIINGERHGSYKSYFINGQIEVDCNYINGELDGIYKSYFINGQIKKDCNYINGKRHGFYKTYYDNGNLKNQLHYNNDTLDEDERFHSFYDNKAKYREGNFGENGLVKEYFKNGGLKFLKDKNKYTFYNEDNNLKCEIYITGYYNYIGIWKNYREDGTIEYELDFDDPTSDVKNNMVSKTIFTKGGELFSKNPVSYKDISGSHLLYCSEDSDSRREGGLFNQPPRFKGPPGPNGSFTIDLNPISSIEDIIKFL